MDANNRSIRIQAHNALLIVGILWEVCTQLLIWVTIYVLLYHSPPTSDDVAGASFFMFVSALVAVAFFLALPRWSVTLTFDFESIRYKTAFRKEFVRPYESYPYVFRASYTHVCYKPVFIVFANRRLSSYEQTHINQVGIADDMIKIRYSKKTLMRMLEVLPPRPRSQLAGCFHNELDNA